MNAPTTAQEKHSEATDDRFHHLIDAATDYAIFLLDPQGIVTTWSAGARRLKGYEADEIIGRHFSVFYSAADRAIERPKQILDTVEREGRYEEEGWRYRKDGSRFWANVILTPLRSETGALQGFAKVTRDLSERRAAAEALRQSEERFRMLVEGVTDYAIYMLDPSGIVATWNVGAERMKGYRASEIIGKSFTTFFPEADIDAGKPARELEVAAREGRFEDNAWRIRKDGSRLWANVILTPLRSPDGELLGFAKITRDLTAARQAQEVERLLLREQLARAASEKSRQQLLESEEAARRAARRAEEATRQAEETSRTKDEFLATVSHELRNPLNAIIGWSTILLQAPDASSREKGLEAIHRNAVAQARLIDDVLDVSRIVTGKLRLELCPVEFGAIVRDAIDVVHPAADARKIGIDLRIAPDLPMLVADPDRLRQVVWNLLSNAVKFSNPGGRISVVVARDQSRVQLRVADSGKGIAPEFLPFVFERFRQEDASTNRRFSGLGLGLSIVRHIVELHGGTVRAESAGANRGAEFVVALPVSALMAVPQAANEPSQEQDAPQSLLRLFGMPKVLVVDDEPDACALLRLALGRAGASVETASSASEALTAVDQFRPDVLVSDIGMPIDDGYALLRKLRSRPPELGGNIPAIALTAYSRAEDRALAFAAGFTKHMSKPVDLRELIAGIDTLVMRAR